MLQQAKVRFDAGAVFAALPGSYLILLPDAPQFTIVGATESYLFLTGTKKETITGRGIFEVFTDNPANSAPTGVQNLRASLQHVLQHKAEHTMPHQRYDTGNLQTGNFVVRIWSALNKPVLNEVGAVQYIIHRIEDITQNIQLKEREKAALEESKHHRAYINAEQSGMSLFKPVMNETGDVVDFRFIIANPAFAAYVGQAPAALEGALGSTWFPGYLSNGVFDMYKRTYLTNEIHRQNIHYNVDGHDLYLDLMSTKVGDEVLVTFTDYTPLQKARVQLETNVEELKRSNANLEEFAHVTSHDLQEPLRKIQFYTNFLLERVELNSEARKYTDKVSKAAKRMTGLIKDLLDYSRLSQSSKRFEMVNLDMVLEKVVSDYELLIAQKSAVIKSDRLEGIDAISLQMNQLFFNLVGNALKFTKRDVPPVITIEAQKLTGIKLAGFPQLHPHKDYYQVLFKDNGIGFQQEYADKIFNIFQCLNERSIYSGYGIGLALCKKIVDAHQGIIYANGKQGEGAVFTIILPCRQA